MSSRGAAVVRRQVGRQLRALREEAGKTIQDVEEAMIFSTSKLFRIETGRASLKAGDVWTLCRFYGAEPDLTESLSALCRAGAGDTVWEDHHNVAPAWFHLYRSLEASCDAIFTYQPELVHGLLQTDEYRDCMIATDGASDAHVIRRRQDIRLERQLTAFGHQGKQLTAVFGVAALSHRFGSKDLMRRQYEHLCAMNAGPSVHIRVLPATVGVRATFHGPFTLVDFDDPEDPPVVYLETLVGAHYINRPEHVEVYRTSAEVLVSASIPIQEFEP